MPPYLDPSGPHRSPLGDETRDTNDERVFVGPGAGTGPGSGGGAPALHEPVS